MSTRTTHAQVLETGNSFTLFWDDSCKDLPTSGRGKFMDHTIHYSKAMAAHGLPTITGLHTVICQNPPLDMGLRLAQVKIPAFPDDQGYRLFTVSIRNADNTLLKSTLVIAEDDVCVYSTYEVIAYDWRRNIPAELWTQVDLALADIKKSWEHCCIPLPAGSPYAPEFYSVAAGPLQAPSHYPVDSREADFLYYQQRIGGEVRKISIQSNGKQMGYVLLRWNRDGKLRHNMHLVSHLPPDEILKKVTEDN
ncbi:hypothetical protein JT27_18640 [Alcaligenes faecalis]|uniref:hypothetical protein n=1 Tax=Alcaligenes faecalis TaxID=511 RepID=UPI00052D5AFD|nr:hypothetical protein [Alcaligenes faecalis]KGP00344.1 hypothetical protein JT27_18640 [Alcaligenes faecalis]